MTFVSNAVSCEGRGKNTWDRTSPSKAPEALFKNHAESHCVNPSRILPPSNFTSTLLSWFGRREPRRIIVRVIRREARERFVIRVMGVEGGRGGTSREESLSESQSLCGGNGGVCVSAGERDDMAFYRCKLLKK